MMGLVAPKTEVSRTSAAVPSNMWMDGLDWLSWVSMICCPLWSEKPAVCRRVSKPMLR